MEFQGLIQKLLTSHPCVVLPGFGAFITRDGQSQFNRFSGMLKPGSKGVFFSTSVHENDGLLFSDYAKQFAISYTDAITAVTKEIEEIKVQLKQHKAMRFGELGTFSLSQEGATYFMPAAYTPIDKKSFGLEPIYIQPFTKVEKPLAATPAKEKVTETKSELTYLVINEEKENQTETAKTTFRKDYQKGLIWKVAAAIAIISLFGLSGTRIYTFLNKGSIEKASLIAPSPILEKETIQVVEAKPQVSTESVDNSNIERKVTTLHKEKVNSAIKLESGKSGKFAVIAGSYNIEQNASEAATLLIKKGLQVKMIKYGKCTLIRLILGEFDTEEDAKSLLDQVKGQLPECGDFFVKKI